jgi:hypothetical protein
VKPEVYEFPSHSANAEQAYGVKVDGALVGLVERYPDGSWHMGGSRWRKLGWIGYDSRDEVVKMMLGAEELDRQPEMESEEATGKDSVAI